MTILIQEFAALQKVSHPNVVQLFEFLEDADALVLEYCPKGNLLKYLTSRTEPVPEQLRLKWAGTVFLN